VRKEMHTEFWCRNVKEKTYLEALGENWSIILKWILQTQEGRVGTGFIWLLIGTSGGLL
jgi:hypothetical protein